MVDVIRTILHSSVQAVYMHHLRCMLQSYIGRLPPPARGADSWMSGRAPQFVTKWFNVQPSSICRLCCYVASLHHEACIKTPAVCSCLTAWVQVHCR